MYNADKTLISAFTAVWVENEGEVLSQMFCTLLIHRHQTFCFGKYDRYLLNIAGITVIVSTHYQW